MTTTGVCKHRAPASTPTHRRIAQRTGLELAVAGGAKEVCMVVQLAASLGAVSEGGVQWA
jgi:hypothetical protein